MTYFPFCNLIGLQYTCITGSGEIRHYSGRSPRNGHVCSRCSAIDPQTQEQLSGCHVKQVWFADEATGAGSCENLRQWWDQIEHLGPTFGYHPNGAKTYLIVKEEHENKAKALFADTDVHITINGKRHLGAAFRCKHLHRRICLKQSQRMGQRDHSPVSSSHYPTSCSLCCFHPWTFQSLDLHLQDYTRYSGPAPSLGDSHPPTFHPCTHWTRDLFFS